MVYKLARKSGFEIEQERLRTVVEGRKLAIDEEGVLQFIQEYPGILTLHHTERKGADTFFYLADCPFVGRMHKRDPRHAAIILKPDAICFHCLSDDCAGNGFARLRDLLHEKTGRWPSMDFYHKKDVGLTDADYLAWGMDPPWAEEHEERLKATPEWQYDSATWLALSSPKFADCPLSTDPAEWGLTADDVFPFWFDEARKKLHDLEGCDDLETFRAECGAVFHSRDPKAMGAFLGKKWLFIISRGKDRPPEPESRVPKRYLSAEEFQKMADGGSPRIVITGRPDRCAGGPSGQMETSGDLSTIGDSAPTPVLPLVAQPDDSAARTVS
jgi:hypothetical protein